MNKYIGWVAKGRKIGMRFEVKLSWKDPRGLREMLVPEKLRELPEGAIPLVTKCLCSEMQMCQELFLT